MSNDPAEPDDTRRPARSAAVLAVAAIAVAIAIAIGGGSWQGGRAGGVKPVRLVLDANAASPELLASLPRVGPGLAKSIVAERARGPFRSIRDLDRRVRGIGPVTRAALAPHLRFADAAAAP